MPPNIAYLVANLCCVSASPARPTALPSCAVQSCSTCSPLAAARLTLSRSKSIASIPSHHHTTCT